MRLSLLICLFLCVGVILGQDNKCNCKKIAKEFQYFEQTVRINKYPFFAPKKPIVSYADGTQTKPKINKHISIMLACIPEVTLLPPSFEHIYLVYDRDLSKWEDWLKENCKNEFEAVKLKIDKITIYSLPQFSTYLTNLNCDDIKTKEDVVVFDIINEKKIKSFTDKFRYENITMDSSIRNIDVRILIEFKVGEFIVKSICWSPQRRLKFENSKTIYSYNQNLEDFLLEEKLIIKLEK